MAATNRRHADLGLFRFHHDGALFLISEAPPAHPPSASRFALQGLCQARFERFSLSSLLTPLLIFGRALG